MNDKKINLIDLSVQNNEYKSVENIKDKEKIGWNYLNFLDKTIEINYVRFGQSNDEKDNFTLLKYNFYGFLRLLKIVKSSKNSVVLLHGFVFPVSFFVLKVFISKKTKFIIQHHAEKPSKNKLKLFVQQVIYPKANAYLFTSKEQALPFLTSKIIIAENKVFELLECSTTFNLLDKNSCRKKLGIPENENVFIWVGGLDANKDPMCMLKAIHLYKKKNNQFKVYLFFNREFLLPELLKYIYENNLEEFIIIKGNLKNQELEIWFNAADVFISCSHYEAMGVALSEAISCGCFPVVTSIPSFKKMTKNGKIGCLFEKGNSTDLYEKLNKISFNNLHKNLVRNHFNEHLSFHVIGKEVSDIIYKVFL